MGLWEFIIEAANSLTLISKRIIESMNRLISSQKGSQCPSHRLKELEEKSSYLKTYIGV